MPGPHRPGGRHGRRFLGGKHKSLYQKLQYFELAILRSSVREKLDFLNTKRALFKILDFWKHKKDPLAFNTHHDDIRLPVHDERRLAPHPPRRGGGSIRLLGIFPPKIPSHLPVHDERRLRLLRPDRAEQGGGARRARLPARSGAVLGSEDIVDYDPAGFRPKSLQGAIFLVRFRPAGRADRGGRFGRRVDDRRGPHVQAPSGRGGGLLLRLRLGQRVKGGHGSGESGGGLRESVEVEDARIRFVRWDLQAGWRGEFLLWSFSFFYFVVGFPTRRAAVIRFICVVTE